MFIKLAACDTVGAAIPPPVLPVFPDKDCTGVVTRDSEVIQLPTLSARVTGIALGCCCISSRKSVNAFVAVFVDAFRFLHFFPAFSGIPVFDRS